jgi:hypothetical protein
MGLEEKHDRACPDCMDKETDRWSENFEGIYMGCLSIMSWVWGLDRCNVIFFSRAVPLSELVIKVEYT